MQYFGRHRIINDRSDQEPYLERFYIFLKERDNFPFNIFLHKFLKSDPDDLHDHPWSYRTIILWGGYWEYTDKGKFMLVKQIQSNNKKNRVYLFIHLFLSYI